jgi:hypothetical protein
MSWSLAMNQRRRNWQLWTGFLLCVIAFASYVFVFARFPVTRDVPWATFMIFAVGIVALLIGLKHALGQPQQYRGKIMGPILATLGLAIVGFFCFTVFYQTRQLPASSGAPRVGQKAPELVLPDTSNHPVSLSSLLSVPLAVSQAPPKGVLLVFYRGYW